MARRLEGLLLYSYEGPGKDVTLSLRACATNSFCFQLNWLMELYVRNQSGYEKA
jgi:hypothetical protein